MSYSTYKTKLPFALRIPSPTRTVSKQERYESKDSSFQWFHDNALLFGCTMQAIPWIIAMTTISTGLTLRTASTLASAWVHNHHHRSLIRTQRNSRLLSATASTQSRETFSSSQQVSEVSSPPSTKEDQGSDDDINNNNHSLMASRLGLNPSQNKFHAPIVYHENYSFADWPPNHTFPMDKFERIANALQTTLISSSSSASLSSKRRPLVQSTKDFFRPLDLEYIPYDDWFFSIMDTDYVTRFLEGMLTIEEARYIGFREQTSRPELIERTVLEVAGTVLTCQLALQYGIASNVAGGTHHASPTGGAGYTILNDLAVSSNFLLNSIPTSPTPRASANSDSKINDNNNIRRVLVVDCDVHQGDGTAKFDIPGLYTLSLHCASNYPRLKANSTFDVGIADNCRDEEYLHILESNVNKAIEEVQPDLVIYDAGVDIYEHDKLGRLKVTENGIRQRDHWVLDRCVSTGIPVAAVVGGGYDKDVDALARRHAIVHEECASVWRKYCMWNR